jgi:hypothetical protein
MIIIFYNRNAGDGRRGGKALLLGGEGKGVWGGIGEGVRRLSGSF